MRDCAGFPSQEKTTEGLAFLYPLQKRERERERAKSNWLVGERKRRVEGQLREGNK